MTLSIKAILLLWIGTALGLLLWRWLIGPKNHALIPRSIQITIFVLPAAFYSLPDIHLWFLLLVLLLPVLLTTTKVSLTLAFCALVALIPPLTYQFSIGPLNLFALSGFEALAIGLFVSAWIALRGRSQTRGAVPDILFAFLVILLVSFRVRDGGIDPRGLTEVIVTVVFPYIALRRMINSPQAMQHVANGIVFSAIILCGIAFVEWLWRWPLFHSAYQHYGIPLPGTSVFTRMRGSSLRIPATFVESTSFGVFLSLALIATVSQSRLFLTRNRQSIAVLLIACVIFVTYSRAAVLGSFVGIVALLAVRGQLARSFATIATFGIAGVFVWFLANWSVGIEQIVRPEAGGSISYRSEFWRQGIEIVRDHPWSGVTLKEMNERMPSLTGEGFVDPVNTYLYFSIRAGLMGGIILAVTLLVPMLMLWATRQRLPTKSLQSHLGMVFGWLAMLAFQFGVTSFHERNPLWLMLSLAMTAALLGSFARRAPTMPHMPAEA
jgi:O-antigen ligase